MDQAFLEAIRERPGTDQDCMVYADWLEDQGDPRGPFIRLQCRAARLSTWGPQRLGLEADAQALLLQHEAEWLGPLLGVVSNWEFRRGLLRFITVDAATFLAHAAEWLPALPLLGVHLRKARGHVAALASCPQLAYLNGLYLGDNELTDDDLRQLAASPHLHRVTELYLQSNRFGPEGMRALASSSRLPRLRELNLGANRLRDEGLLPLLEAKQFKHLRHLILTMSFFEAPGLQALARSTLLRRLHKLVLLGNFLPAGSLKLLVESPSFGRMRFLAFDMNDPADADIEALAASPHARQLTGLSLSSDHSLGDRSLVALANSPNLGRLRDLYFGPSQCGRVGLEALGQSTALKSLKSLHLQEGERKLEQNAPFLLRGPLIRQLRDLDLESGPLGIKGLEALASHPAPLRLRRYSLTLAKDEAPAWEALLARGSLRRLTELTLVEPPPGSLQSLLAPTRLRYLKKLRLYGLPAEKEEALAFAGSRLVRQLQQLTLSLQEDKEGGDILRTLTAVAAAGHLQRLELSWSLSPEQVGILTAQSVWPRLSSLLIGSFNMRTQGAQLLADWPLLGQLRFLTLWNSSSQLVPGLEALARSPHVSPLLRVDIRNGSVTTEARPILRQRFGLRFAGSGRKEPFVVTIGGWGALRGDDD